jgi:hypothetical protein
VPTTHADCHLSGEHGNLASESGTSKRLALAEPGHISCADVKTLTLTHLDDVWADLRRLESILTRTVDQCSGAEAPICPVLDMLSGPPDHLNRHTVVQELT